MNCLRPKDAALCRTQRRPRRRWASVAIVAAALSVGIPARAQPTAAVLRIQYGAQAPLNLTADILRAHGEDSVTVQWQRGTDTERAQFGGARVRSLLTLLGIPSGTELRGAWHTVVVTAVAADGYQVRFGIGELDPSLSGRKAIVAWSRDGQPLASGEAPWRLVIEGDRRPSRSVRQLVAIHVSEPQPRTATSVVDPDHDGRSLDHRDAGRTQLQAEFVDRLGRDHRREPVAAADVDANLRMNGSAVDVRDGALDLIAR